MIISENKISSYWMPDRSQIYLRVNKVLIQVVLHLKDYFFMVKINIFLINFFLVEKFIHSFNFPPNFSSKQV